LPYNREHNRRRIWLIAGAFVATTVVAELTIRLSGVTNFPIYLKHAALGYVPAPNQSGTYRNGNDWVYNDMSMGVQRPFQPKLRPATILVGDSIVNGDYWLRHVDTLGPQLEQLSCGAIWPISAGGWALVNEIRYFREHRELLGQVDRIVFVLNSGDLVSASQWTSELTHPTYRPLFLLPYIVRRHILHERPPSSEARETDEWRQELSWLEQSFPGQIVVALYPLQDEFSNEGLRERQLNRRAAQLEAVAPGRLRFVDIAVDPLWKKSFYHDGVHPTASGVKALAQILSKSIECDSTHSAR
jgi:hypothetical protein